MLIAMIIDPVQGLWLLLHYQYWILTRTPLRYSVPWRSCSLVLQVWSLHVLQQFIDEVGVGVGQLKALDLGLSGS